MNTNIRPERLPNQKAISHAEAKTLITGEIESYHHALAFTISRLAQMDMLAEIKAGVDKAMKDGLTEAEFRKLLTPYLVSKGWLNADPKKIGNRLDLILTTNRKTAYASAKWERIQATKDTFPYLKYMPSLSVQKRDEHTKYYGIVRPVDDPIWQSIFPPNSWNCRCYVKRLTKKEAQKEGITDDKTIENLDLSDLDFNHNHDRLGALLKLAEDRHGRGFVKELTKEIVKIAPTALPTALPTQWQDVAKIGEEIYQKHQAIFDKVDFDKPFDFSNAVLEVMALEGVEMGGVVNAIGDNVEQVQEILGRYPKSWVEKANEVGKTFVKNTDDRGWHYPLASQEHIKRITGLDAPKEVAIFAHIFNQMNIGDSLLNVNSMGGNIISSQAYNVTVHEFAHRLQYVMPELDEYFTQLWLDRTKGEKTRPLAVIQAEKGEPAYYNEKELGRKDNFVNVYIGKNYGNDKNPRPKEVMTMTFETLLGSGMKKYTNAEISDIKEYWQNDKELLYLGLALLIRYQP